MPKPDQRNINRVWNMLNTVLLNTVPTFFLIKTECMHLWLQNLVKQHYSFHGSVEQLSVCQLIYLHCSYNFCLAETRLFWKPFLDAYTRTCPWTNYLANRAECLLVGLSNLHLILILFWKWANRKKISRFCEEQHLNTWKNNMCSENLTYIYLVPNCHLVLLWPSCTAVTP